MNIARSVGGLFLAVIMIFIAVGVFDLIGGKIFNTLPDAETGTVPPEANVTGYCLWNLGFYLLICCGGSWVAGAVAGRAPMLHASVITGLVLAAGVAFFIFGKGVFEKFGIDIPGWYLPLLPIFGSVGALLGGAIHRRDGTPPPDAS